MDANFKKLDSEMHGSHEAEVEEMMDWRVFFQMRER